MPFPTSRKTHLVAGALAAGFPLVAAGFAGAAGPSPAPGVRLVVHPLASSTSSPAAERQVRRVLSQLPYEVWRLSDQSRPGGACRIELERADAASRAAIPTAGILQDRAGAARRPDTIERTSSTARVEVVEGRLDVQKDQFRWALRLGPGRGRAGAEIVGTAPSGDPLGTAERIARELVARICRE